MRDRGRREAAGFDDVLRLALPAQIGADAASGLRLDTYALRNLVWAAPAAVRPLSSLLASPTRFLQRAAVSSASGEECICTVELLLQEALVPRCGGSLHGMALCSLLRLRSVYSCASLSSLLASLTRSCSAPQSAEARRCVCTVELSLQDAPVPGEPVCMAWLCCSRLHLR
jgi:hypothetical protein